MTEEHAKITFEEREAEYSDPSLNDASLTDNTAKEMHTKTSDAPFTSHDPTHHLL